MRRTRPPCRARSLTAPGGVIDPALQHALADAVMPANAGNQRRRAKAGAVACNGVPLHEPNRWIPASAGMTALAFQKAPGGGDLIPCC